MMVPNNYRTSASNESANGNYAEVNDLHLY